MLKLKKLQILGFKSFCDRTELQFPGTGIVGIVGPNGCGKSNLADAISWVLGEQSAKSLRGGRMEDVIFAGTRDRPATGLAEVSLTLIDPQEYELDPRPEAEAEPEPEPVADDGWDDPQPGETSGETSGETPAPAAHSGAVVLTIRKRRRFIAHNRRGEVVVTRRLYRNGESEYLMNGRPCRLRDIQDIFMGTGLGPESYAIIEQGRIGQILSSKPYDRRAIIEEAAGVSKYKARRRMAESRLEAARLNLSRINDIFEEVTRQVGSLKRQAAKAQRYRRLKTEFDHQQRRLILGRAAGLEAALAGTRERHERAKAAWLGAQQRIEAREAERAAALLGCQGLEGTLRALTEETGRLASQLGHSTQQVAFHQQQGAELERRGGDNDAERGRLAEQSARLEAELAQARLDQDASGAVLAAASAACEERRAAFKAAQAALLTLESRIEAARRQTLQLMAQAAGFGNQIAQGETQLAGLERQLQRLAVDENGAQTELDAGGTRRGQLQIEFQDQESAARGLDDRLQELDREVARLQAEEAAERREAQQARAQLADVSARRRSLEEIVAHHGYSSEAVKRLFGAAPTAAASRGLNDDAPRPFQPLGVLGEFLEVEAPYDQAVEQFLHEELNYVVVADWDQAQAGVGALRAQKQGRATFLVHAPKDADGAAEASEPAPGPGDEPGVVRLLGEVKGQNGFAAQVGRILPKLRDAYLLPEGAPAEAWARLYPRAYLLTARGECFYNFTVTGGAGASSGPLSLKRELRELTRGEAAAAAALARREQHAELLLRQLGEARREVEALRAQRHESEKRLLTSGQAVRQLDAELGRAQARLRQLQLEGERCRAEQRQAAERLQRARDEQERVERERAEMQRREAAATEEAAEARRGRELASQTLGEAQSELARIEERAGAARAACQRLERLAADTAARLEQMRAEAAALAERRRGLLAAVQQLELDIERLRAEHAAGLERKAAGEAALADARAREAGVEERLAAERRGSDALRQAQGDLEVALARLEADLQHLAESCRNDLGCEIAELRAQWEAAQSESAVAAAAPEAPPLDGEAAEEVASVAAIGGEAELAALDASVRALRARIDNLGPVNMMALEEFEEAQQRHAFMDAQRKDLLDSIANTNQAIQEIDIISRQKFQEAFERINEYFQESFRVLFGGGQGFLRLSEAEGNGESGVDLVAQPPGKKLQNALLLSGGEKAMTAMALLLAIFRYQPSPFCLLDEVDAPMDEANVARFSEMVKAMGASTQFIIITHNKRTMEAAPTLYGVTMTQPGVSRLVSVLVEEREQRAAAS